MDKEDCVTAGVPENRRCAGFYAGKILRYMLRAVRHANDGINQHPPNLGHRLVGHTHDIAAVVEAGFERAGIHWCVFHQAGSGPVLRFGFGVGVGKSVMGAVAKRR
jgi:hypothetical protein